MDFQVHIDDEEVRRLLSVDFGAVLGNITFAVATQVQARLAPYPPATEANRPRTFASKARNGWYERGYGPRWARKDGSVGGRKTSELMNRNWHITRQGVNAELVNNASYSAFVHRDPTLGDPHQAFFHGQRGWMTDVKVVTELVSDGTVDAIVSMAIGKAVGE